MKKFIIFCFFIFYITKIQSYPSALPLVRLKKGKNYKLVLGVDISKYLNEGYNSEGAIGWAYKTNIPGTVPLYHYSRKIGNVDLYSTRNNFDNCDDSLLCFEKKGILAYIFRGRELITGEPVTCYNEMFFKKCNEIIPLYKYFDGNYYQYLTKKKIFFNDEFITSELEGFILPLEKPRVDVTDEMLWEKYKNHLIENISKKFCGGTIDCNRMKDTAFHIETKPSYARWSNDPNDLNNQVCYAPKYSVAWEFISVSHDGKIQNLYKNFLLSIPNKELSKNNFINFSIFSNRYNEKCFTWEERGIKLKNWLNDIRIKPKSYVGFDFHFDIDFENSEKNHWTNFGTIKGKDYFIRTEKQTIMNDNSLISINSPSSDYKSNVIEGIQVIHSNRFDLTFKSRGVQFIEITPSSEWFNHDLSLQYRNYFRKYISFLPLYVVVASDPKIEVVVSKSIHDEIVKRNQHGDFLNWMVGGIQFENINSFSSDNPFKNNKIIKMEKLSDKTIENIIPQMDGEYKITFDTKSNDPQILGFISIVV